MDAPNTGSLLQAIMRQDARQDHWSRNDAEIPCVRTISNDVEDRAGGWAEADGGGEAEFTWFLLIEAMAAAALKTACKSQTALRQGVAASRYAAAFGPKTCGPAFMKRGYTMKLSPKTPMAWLTIQRLLEPFAGLPTGTVVHPSRDGTQYVTVAYGPRSGERLPLTGV